MKLSKSVMAVVCFVLAAATSGCTANAQQEPEDEQVGTAEQAATAVKLAGKYYYRTDHFSESCSAGHLSVRTSWSNGSDAYTNIPRDDTTYVAPAQAGNGSFEWHCGNVLANGSDYSECNNAPADFVRVYWSPNSSNIDMQCFKICGDGSSQSDCNPF